MCKVFLLEDDEAIADIVVYLLLDAGYEVSASPTIAAFQNLLKNSLPDLFILDMMLPDGNGVDVCRKLKEMPDTHHIPVLMMSAQVNGHTLAKTVSVDDFISKPFDIDLLLQKVKTQTL